MVRMEDDGMEVGRKKRKEDHVPRSHVLGLDRKSLVRLCCRLNQEPCLHDSGIHNYINTSIFLNKLFSNHIFILFIVFWVLSTNFFVSNLSSIKNVYTSRKSEILEELVNHI